MTRALTWILAATLAGACAGQEQQVEYAASVNVDRPELVALGPDVDVVVGAREPVFRTNNAFWLYRGESWYRSDELRGASWVRIVTPPSSLTAIVEPGRFANYRADRTVYRQDLTTPAMREPAPAPAEPAAPYPPPPKQTPPVMPDDPGTTTDRVPDPTMPSQPGPLFR